MIRRISEDKSIFKIKMLKEVGYILLLVTFFVGVIIGSLSFKSIDSTSFEEYTEYLSESISNINSKEVKVHTDNQLYSGIKVIAIFWIVGMSIIGTPILIGYLGYKGYSMGYTISAIIKLLGVSAGNSFVFKYMFLKNLVLVFIMIFLANFSIKISKNFFEKKTNLKPDALKYSIIAGFMLIVWIIAVFIQKMIFINF